MSFPILQGSVKCQFGWAALLQVEVPASSHSFHTSPWGMLLNKWIIEWMNEWMHNYLIVEWGGIGCCLPSLFGSLYYVHDFSCLKKGYFVLQVPQKITNETKRTRKQKPWLSVKERSHRLGAKGQHSGSLSNPLQVWGPDDTCTTQSMKAWTDYKALQMGWGVSPHSSHPQKALGLCSLSEVELGCPSTQWLAPAPDTGDPRLASPAPAILDDLQPLVFFF